MEITVTAVLVGEQHINHKIVIPKSMEKDSSYLGHEFLKKQYPSRYSDMVDIAVETPK